MSDRTFEEQKRDAYLVLSGWLPLDREDRSGLWIHRMLGTMRHAEAVAKQTSEHLMLTLSWDELASPKEREMIAWLVFKMVVGEVQKMAADPELKQKIMGLLSSAETKAEVKELGATLRPLVKAWLAEGEERAGR